MRIAYVCADFGVPIHGNKGASIHVRELTHALAAAGEDILVLSPRAGGAAPGEYRVTVVEVTPAALELEVSASLTADLRTGRASADEVRGLLYGVSFGQRVISLLGSWRPDVVYERHSLPGLAGRSLATALGVPHLLEVNAPLVAEQTRHRAIHLTATLHALEGQALRSADAVLVVSQPLAGWARARGVAAERLHVLANAVDPKRFPAGGPAARATARRARLRRALGLAGELPVIGFVGSLRPWHDVAGLVRAVADLRRDGRFAQLLIVGDGPSRGPLQELVAAERLADVTVFSGAIEHARVADHLAAVDVAVAPYGASDGEMYFSPLKLFEYGAAGVPVVAADLGDVRHCIRDGASGLLYEPGDQAALGRCLAQMLGDASDAQRMGARLRRHVVGAHTWRMNAQLVSQIAARLAGERARRDIDLAVA